VRKSIMLLDEEGDEPLDGSITVEGVEIESLMLQ
jgi:hypothetical protein